MMLIKDHSYFSQIPQVCSMVMGNMITAVDLYELYYIGTYLEYKGKAIGSGSEGAQITLQVSISCISCVINKDFYSMANSSSIVE